MGGRILCLSNFGLKVMQPPRDLFGDVALVILPLGPPGRHDTSIILKGLPQPSGDVICKQRDLYLVMC